jgi:hypothetical protein
MKLLPIQAIRINELAGIHVPLIGVDSGTDDLTASFEGLKVKRWIFTCSSGGADKKQIPCASA